MESTLNYSLPQTPKDLARQEIQARRAAQGRDLDDKNLSPTERAIWQTACADHKAYFDGIKDYLLNDVMGAAKTYEFPRRIVPTLALVLKEQGQEAHEVAV